MKDKRIKALVVCKHPHESKEASACKIIQDKNIKIIYSWKNILTKKDLKDIDLVIAIGGDGTILSASHYLKNKPFLAVNSNPKISEGALATLSTNKLEKKLNEIIKNVIETEKLERIQISINNSRLPLLALNEVFIANERAYLISKYKIKFKNKEEIQKSSGLIFTTGTGSTAWFKSAGGSPFPKKAKYIKMIVREPFQGRLSKIKIISLTIKEKEKITIVPSIPSILAIDSIREYKLKPDDKIKIQIAKYPLIRIK